MTYHLVIGTELDIGGGERAVTDPVVANVLRRNGDIADLEVRVPGRPDTIARGVVRGTGPGQWSPTDRTTATRALRGAVEGAQSVPQLRTAVLALIDALEPDD